jgi:hypothetical protein
MGYLIFAILMAAALITVLALRDRLARSPGRSVDAFRRAITALTPREDPSRAEREPEPEAGERRRP